MVDVWFEILWVEWSWMEEEGEAKTKRMTQMTPTKQTNPQVVGRRRTVREGRLLPLLCLHSLVDGAIEGQRTVVLIERCQAGKM